MIGKIFEGEMFIRTLPINNPFKFEKSKSIEKQGTISAGTVKHY